MGKSGIYKNLTNYGDVEFSKYMRRAFLASAGYDKTDLDRPIIGIVNTSSDYNICHRQMPQMVESVKRGVLEAGGLAFVFPTISLNEILTFPTTMFYRNLMAMETEEMIKAQPMDAVVLLGGCDKTVPAQCMAAISANIPTIVEVTGPMMTGYYKGERLGACTDCRRLWAKFRAKEISEKQIDEIEKALCFTGGTCMVMGTAQTMALIVETLGLMLPGGATPPSPSGTRLSHCVASGRQAVYVAKNNIKPKDFLTRKSFLNAITVLMSVSGSTNAIVHLIAMARRAGIDLCLNEFDKIAKKTPIIVDIKPVGIGYMEDLHHAGGAPVLLKTLEPLLSVDQKTVTGKTIKQNLEHAENIGNWQTTIRPLDKPLKKDQAISVFYGNLAKNGAIIKSAAATQKLLKHKGPAIVFESSDDASKRIDDPKLKITENHVMILRNSGPVGAGMPEAGSLPIPKYLSEKGIKDMVRISDARMSGTAYGTVFLHCSPEAAIGGCLALVKDGDEIEVDVEKRKINLLVDETELKRRKEKFKLKKMPKRGWEYLYKAHVEQAHLGADLDFL